MVAAKGQKDIGDRLNKVVTALADANGLKGIINVADFNDDDKLGKGKDMVERLTSLIAIFENPDLDFSKNRADGDDLLGDAYEYLMRHFATESGKSKGQFYTPSEVSQIMARLVGVDHATSSNQTIYDPTCGSGSLLLKAAAAAPVKLTIYGQEMDNATYALARMNMILHDNEMSDIAKGNTLAEPATWDSPSPDQLKQHDFIVANPPFSTKNWTSGVDTARDRFGRFTGFGVPPVKNGDYAFLLHIVRSLNGSGKGAIILPHGILFRGNAEATIRKALVQKGLIKAIVGLPANLFYGTGIPACIIVIDKEGAGTRTGIFMIDGSRGFRKDGNKNRLREQDMHRIVDAFTRQADEPGYARMVPLTEIADRDYNLNLPRYIAPPDAADHHDIDAHLRGGIPAADLDALAPYWEVYPSLRATLIEPFPGRAGYARVRVAAADIRPTIFEHPEFQAFRQQVRTTFGAWAAHAEPQLRAIDAQTKPKHLLHTLAEDLLTTFAPVHLLDGYDVYQRLMDFWTATLQDDVYAVVEDGWHIRPVQTKRGWSSELLPRHLVIGRYLMAEQTAVDAATAADEEATRLREELEEEYAAEEAALAELATDKGKLPAKVVRTRLKDLNQTKLGKAAPPDPDELAALKALGAAYAQEEETTRLLKKATADLETKLGKQYAALTPAEIQDLLVRDKWLGHLHHLVEQELTRLSQRLAARLTELTERYATPLPAQEARVTEFAQQVHAHLVAMGFSLN